MSADKVAGARDVRDEDAFDVAAVDAWLRENAPSGFEPGAGTELPEVRQFAGGASNLTYLLRYPDRDLILRRPPSGTKARGAHDMSREFTIQQALAPVFPQVPTMVGLCTDECVIGSEFYVMERVVGHIPRKELGLELEPAQVRELCTNTLDLLIDLHGIDPATAGLDPLGKGDGYVERQVAGWSARYRKVITPNVGSMETVMAWLEENRPADVGSCLIHNDFRLDNIVYAQDDPTRPIGLLDWEMATIGDPLMDLGGAMAYWIDATDTPEMQLLRMQPTHLEGMLTRREVVDYYCEKTGRELTPRHWTFYEVFGLFRLAVIAQQIYYRFHHKQTTNPAFEYFWMMVNMLDERCQALIADNG